MARRAKKNPRTSTSYSVRADHSLKALVLQGHWSWGAARLNPASESRSARSPSDQARVVLRYARSNGAELCCWAYSIDAGPKSIPWHRCPRAARRCE